MPHDLKCIPLKWEDKEITETLKSGLNDDFVSEWRCAGIFGLVNNRETTANTLGNKKAKCKYNELSIFKNGNKILEE